MLVHIVNKQEKKEVILFEKLLGEKLFTEVHLFYLTESTLGRAHFTYS